jgi:thioredoxin 1
MLKRIVFILMASVLFFVGCGPETKPRQTPKPSTLIKLDQSNFQELVVGNSKPVMVDISTDWCGWCKKMEPLVEELAAKYKDRVVFGQLDGDKSHELMKSYDIEQAYPTYVMFKNGRIVAKVVGANAEDLTNKLAALAE